MNPETKFKIALFEKLRELPGVWVYKVEAGAVAGIPDILMCLMGSFMAIELKMRGNKPSPIQLKNIDHINKIGGKAVILYHDQMAVFVATIKEQIDLLQKQKQRLSKN